jgi:catechol 1,2-dioxygenase
MRRRRFLRTSALGVGALLLKAGCGAPGPSADGGLERDADGGAEPADAGTDAGTHPDAGTPPDGGTDAGTDAGVTPQCEETEDNILGPFYRPNAPFRSTLGEAGDGELLFLHGTVSGLDPGCVRLDGALLDVWQANAAGAYDNTSPDFRFRGRLHADAVGNYALQTILPGRYLNGQEYRPRHIHLRVSSPGFVLLTTQLYFKDDPFLASDPFVRPSLVVPLEQDAAGWHARFDIVLRKA